MATDSTVPALSPADAPLYLIQYYGNHLHEEYDSDPSPKNIETMLSLLNEGWLRAWQRIEGAPQVGFLTDVDRAWRAARLANDIAQANGDPMPYLAAEIRCVLCHISVNSWAQSLTADLVAKLVRAGVWTPDQGLQTAQRQIKDKRKSAFLSALVPFLSSIQLNTGLSIAEQITDPLHRAECLAALGSSPRLEADSGVRHQCFAIDLINSFIMHDCAKPQENEKKIPLTLAAMVPYLRVEVLDRALDTARSLRRWEHRCAGLIPLLHRLAKPRKMALVAECLSQTREGPRDLSSRSDSEHQYLVEAKALAKLAASLPGDERQEVLIEASLALKHLGAKLSLGLISDVAASLPLAAEDHRIINDKVKRFDAALKGPEQNSPQSKELQELLAEVVACAYSGMLCAAQASSDSIQTSSMQEIAYAPESVLSSAEQHRRLIEELAATQIIKDDPGLVLEAVASLAPRLDSDLASYLAQKVFCLAYSAQRVSCWAQLFVAVPVELQDSIFDGILESIEHPSRGLPRFDPEDAPLTQTLWSSDLSALSCEGVLAFLAPCLAPPQMEKALYLAKRISDLDRKASAISELAPYLSPAQLSEALSIASVFPFDRRREPLLMGLAPYLPERLIPTAVALVENKTRPWRKENSLQGKFYWLRQRVLRPHQFDSQYLGYAAVALAPRLAPKDRRSLLLRSKQWEDQDSVPRRDYWVSVASVLHALRKPGDQLPLFSDLLRILSSNSEDGLDDEKVRDIMQIALNMPNSLAAQALEIVFSLEWHSRKVGSAVLRIAERLPQPQRQVVIDKAVDVCLEKSLTVYYRIANLKTLAPHMSSRTAEKIVVEIIRDRTRATRTAFLSEFACWLGPLLLRLDSNSIPSEVADAILDVCDWWP